MTVTPYESMLMFMGSAAILGALLLFLDWLGRRKERQQRQGSAR